jgi:hypothetical protein
MFFFLPGKGATKKFEYQEHFRKNGARSMDSQALVISRSLVLLNELGTKAKETKIGVFRQTNLAVRMYNL